MTRNDKSRVISAPDSGTNTNSSRRLVKIESPWNAFEGACQGPEVLQYG